MSIVQRLLRGVEANEAKINQLTRVLDDQEKTIQNLQDQAADFGGLLQGAIKASQGEIRLGDAKTGGKIDKDGFSVFAFALAAAQDAVARYDILTNLKATRLSAMRDGVVPFWWTRCFGGPCHVLGSVNLGRSAVV